MAPSRFNMKSLAHAKLATVDIDYDLVRNGPTRGPCFRLVVHRDSRNSRQMHGLFHEFVLNASSMAPSRFNMKRLAHAKLTAVGIDHDPVKNGTTRGPSSHSLVLRDLRYSRQIHGMFHACVLNASSMAPSRFNMKRLAHAKLTAVGIEHDPVKNGPTRGPTFHSLVLRDLRYSRQMHGLFHEFVLNASLMAPSRFKPMPSLQLWESTMIP
jgi:hypothetical protein